MDVANLSVYLAQVLGIYLFVVFLSMLLHHQRHKKIMSEMLTNSTMIALSGGILTLIGAAIVVAHNVWVSDWPVLITLVGWVSLLQGILRVFLPDAYCKLVRDMMSKAGYLVWCWLWFVVGLYLLWEGFGFAG